MPVIDLIDRQWLDALLDDPTERYRCHVLDALAAVVAAVAPEVAAVAPEAAAAAAAPASAAIDLGTLDVIAPAVGDAAAAAAPTIGAGDVLGGAAAGGGLAAALGGAPAAAAPGSSTTGDVSGAGPADTLLPSGAAPAGQATPIPTAPTQPPLTFASAPGTPVTAAPLTTPPPATPVTPAVGSPVSGGPVGVAPAAPAAAGPQTFAETGITPSAGSSLADSLTSSPDITGGTTLGTTTQAPLTAGQTDIAAAGGAVPSPAATTAGTAAKGGFLDSLFGAGTSNTLGDIGKIAAPVASLGGLGLALMNANTKVPGQPQLASVPGTITASTEAAGNAATTAANNAATTIDATAGGQIAQGQTLENYLAAGTLPPGVQAGISSAANSAKAAIRSQYANRGESGSSAEAEDLANVDSQAVSAGTTIATQLLQQGASMVGTGVSEEATAGQLATSTDLATGTMDLNAESLAQQIYTQIMNTSLAQDQQLGSAIGNFASALAGSTTKPGTITINTNATQQAA
jgi:hypothetical protein